MKKIKSVFIFDGGKQGYLNLVDSEEKVTFYCHSVPEVTAQTKLDIAFHKGYPNAFREAAQKAISHYRKEGKSGEFEMPITE